jgi:hypothetical protein
MQRGIVAVFGLLAGVCVGHGKKFLAETGF